jgi:TPR repeat protein
MARLFEHTVWALVALAAASAALAAGVSTRGERGALAAVSTEQLAVRAGAGRDAQALQQLRYRAEGGAAQAQQALGSVLAATAEAADRSEALRWLQAAQQQGDAQASYQLGKLHLQSGPQHDEALAARDFERAAEAGHAGAALQRGLLARRARDPAAAARWLAQAAQAHDPQALFLLANAAREGDGVPRDEARALRLYREAAALEYPPAHQALAMAWERGELGLVRDDEQAREALAEVAHSLKHPPVER